MSTLIKDIYTLLETKEVPEGVNLEEICADFGTTMGNILQEALSNRDNGEFVRLSGIGKPDRKLYHSFKGTPVEPIRGPTYIKFLYGHLIEGLLLALTKAAGHTVTDEQKKVTVEGVKGHIDCYIDGVLCDIKSASPFGFKKFKYNELHKEDAFGYIPQLKAYAHAEGVTKYAWFAMNKQSGELAWLEYDESDTHAPYAEAVDWDVPQRVRNVKKLEEGPLPEPCYDPEPDGKSGNLKLARGCTYCGFRQVCWPDARTFHYADGPRYLTKVVKEPRVIEVPEDF